MGNILDHQSGRMNVDTYSAKETVNYNVLDNPASKNGVKAISSFQRGNKLHMPIVSNVCYNMRNARGRYKARLKDIAKEIKGKKILPWYRQTKSTHKERLEKQNAHRNKLTKSDLTLRNSYECKQGHNCFKGKQLHKFREYKQLLKYRRLK